MLPAAQSGTAFRKRYLLQTLRLENDPFANISAENDLAVNPSDPLFYLYFVEPDYEPNSGPLLAQLRKPTPSVIGGSPGSGKTMLRYFLEQACRTTPDGTLVVSPLISHSQASILQLNDLPQTISEAVATDLFIQVMDQHHLIEFNPEQVHSVASYWRASIPGFDRKVRLYLKTKPSREMSAWWWPVWRRAAVRFTPDTSERRQFLHQLLAGRNLAPPVAKPEESTYLGLQLAHDLGFTQVFLLLDLSNMAEVNAVAQILANLGSTNLIIPIYPKFFVPSTIYDKTITALQSTFLPSTIFSGIITWSSPEKLVSLVALRWRAGRSWVRDFDTLASQEVSRKLQSALITDANGSPRRLLQLINSLIEAHSSQSPDDPLITADDWRHMCRTWSYGDPTPAFITGERQGPTMTNGLDPNVRQEFNSDLAVRRDHDLEKAEDWLRSTKRLLTVVGPPAIGKTWFFKYLEQEWGRERPVFWLDASEWLVFAAADPRAREGRYNEQHARDSIARLAHTASEKCHSDLSGAYLADLSAVIEHLAPALAKCHPDSRVILLIDGADEAESDSWRSIEREILEPFAGEASIRFVIALRDDWKFRVSSLRYGETRLTLGSLHNPQGIKQIDNLLNHAGWPAARDHLIQLLPSYTWSHLGLNAFIFEAWRATNYTTLGPNLLTNGLQAVGIPEAQLPEVQKLLQEIERAMNGQAVTNPGWTAEELAYQLRITIRDAWDMIAKLRNFWLMETEDNRHRILDGLREFVRAAAQLPGLV